MHRRASVIFALAFLALTGLVWAGAFTHVDRFAVHHLMPWPQFGRHHLIRIGTLFKPETRSTLGGTLVALWTFPASPFVSGLIVLFCSWRLKSVVPLAIWVAANVIELAGKLIVSRPYVGEPGFAGSFPSGHTVRAFVTAAVVTWTWRRARIPAFAWAVGVAVALVAIGDHVPTDVAGGFLLAVALIASRTPIRASGSRP